MSLPKLKNANISPTQERSRIFRSVMVAALLLIVVLLAALATRAATASSRQAVIKAMNLERALNTLLSSLQDAEAGERGYLITGEEKHLEPYLSSLKATPEALNQLSTFLEPGDDKSRFFRLDLLIRERYEELTAAIGLRRAGSTSDALVRMELNDERELMGAIRQEINMLKKAEQVKMDAKITVVDNLFNLDLALGIIVFAGILYILYFLSSRLRPLIAQLENTVEEKDDEIASRRLAEADNDRLIAYLKNKNEDLDHFAYIASHDLQEPLRTVTNFISVIEEDHGEALGEEGKVYFGFINDATERMRTLIETLLRYSQLGQGNDLQSVDLNQVVAEVIMLLDAAIKETNATVDVSPLPVVSAYHVGIAQVFQNLISNALKFVPKGVAPQLEIFQIEDKTDLFKIGVRDNGIGMDEATLGKIFQMFSRINEAGSYEGNGIGLAFCRKIIELHGGEISVTSSPGEGTTFYLTLPKT